MVQIRCDACDKSIELPAAVAGQKVKCPHCGDVNVMRSAGQTLPKDRAAEAGHPPANGPEVVVKRVRPASFRSRPLTASLVIVIALTGAVCAVMLGTNPATFPAGIACGVVSMVAFGVIGYWKVLSMAEGLRITTKRVVDSEGLFSKSTSEVLHADIKNVQIIQSFWQRVWRVGTISISSAGENENPIEMRGVAHPEDVRALIDLYRPL